MIKNGIRKFLSIFERFALPPTDAIAYPPVFIVGPPRSGTTLLYLLLCHRFRVSYISNYLAMTPRSPVLMGRLAKMFRPFKGPADFYNRYGETRGWRGPNQGYRLWNEWLPTDSDYIAPGGISAAARTGLRRTIAGIERINEAPFVNKWQRNALRIEALRHIFPEALFLHVTRNPAQVAQSLLKGRQAMMGDVTAWFSARPADMPTDRPLSPIEEVCYQAVLIDRQIVRDLAKLPPDSHFTLSYEDLCAAPEKMLQAIADWYARCTGYTLMIETAVLPSLSEQHGGKVSAELEAEIAAVCARI